MNLIMQRHSIQPETLTQIQQYKQVLNEFNTLYMSLAKSKDFTRFPLIPIERLQVPESFESISQSFQKRAQLLQQKNQNNDLSGILEQQQELFEMIQQLLSELKEIILEFVTEYQVSDEELVILLQDDLINSKQQQQPSMNASELQTQQLLALEAIIGSRTNLSLAQSKCELFTRFLVDQLLQYVKLQLPDLLTKAGLEPEPVTASSYQKLMNNLDSVICTENRMIHTNSSQTQKLKLKFMNARVQKIQQKQQKNKNNEHIYTLVQKDLVNEQKYSEMLQQLGQDEIPLLDVLDQHVHESEEYRTQLCALAAWKQYIKIQQNQQETLTEQEIKTLCCQQLQIKIEQFEKQEETLIEQATEHELDNNTVIDKLNQLYTQKQKYVQTYKGLEILTCSLEDLENQLNVQEQNIEAYRSILFQYLTEASQRLSKKLVIYSRFCESPEMYIDQRLLVLQNQNDANELNEEIKLLQRQLDIKPEQKGDLVDEFLTFKAQINTYKKQIQQNMLKMKIIQQMINEDPSTDTQDQAQVVFQAESMQYQITQQRLEYLKPILFQRINKHMTIFTESKEQLKMMFEQFQDQIPSLLEQFRGERDFQNQPQFMEILKEFDRQVLTTAQQCAIDFVQRFLIKHNQIFNEYNQMHQEDIYSHQLRFQIVQQRIKELQNQTLNQSRMSMRSFMTSTQNLTQLNAFGQSNFETINQFSRLQDLNKQLSQMLSANQMLLRLQEKFAGIEQLCTQLTQQFKLQCQSLLENFRDEKSNQLMYLYEQYFTLKLSQKLRDWDSQDDEQLNEKLSDIQNQISEIQQICLVIPQTNTYESVDAMLDEQIRLQQHLQRTTDLKSEFHSEFAQLASSQILKAEDLVQPDYLKPPTPTPIPIQPQLQTQVQTQDKIPQDNTRKKMNQITATGLLKKTQQQDITANQISQLKNAFKLAQNALSAHRILGSGINECTIQLVNPFQIVLKQLNKPTQQIKTNQIKTVRFKIINLLGVEMHCFEIYLESGKNAVFGCPDQTTAKQWVTCLRGISENGPETFQQLVEQ
ncbi:Hypothetical_protein [Hexamita inflata]|uniref:Hypothetical_protein n=1 Tax=Hexamita inflata TaxID=28002 RepID=A0AA86TK05_9EUKA|nr:Hypothetical protein HINF_LOCUS7216 [Hexamita inflata]